MKDSGPGHRGEERERNYGTDRRRDERDRVSSNQAPKGEKGRI
jgi:hypothetical protein